MLKDIMENKASRQKIDVMFDTNAFNAVLDMPELIDIVDQKLNVFATHVQRDEISKTKNVDRRNKLLSIFQKLTEEEVASESFVIGTSRIGQAKITSNVVLTESAVWGVSQWDGGKWSEENSSATNQDTAQIEINLYTEILQELNNKNNKDKKVKDPSENPNIRDALIAETAIKRQLLLVTHDADLFGIVTKLHAQATNIYSILGKPEELPCQT